MGLDQNAYTLPSDVDALSEDSNEEREELCYWRKHNRLQGYMERLWELKGKPGLPEDYNSPFGDFNCIPLELTANDLLDLQKIIEEEKLPYTQGFFFGDDSYEWKNEDGDEYEYKEADRDFIKSGLTAISEGKKVYYHCWY